jgi:uncharacterized protein YcsI (UPF0317 family)
MNEVETPREIRSKIARAAWDNPTTGLAPAYAQANLVILDQRYAFDFLLFCVRNAKPCPILEVLEPGVTEPRLTAPGADIRTDLPRYRRWRDGDLEQEVTDVTDCFNKDMVSFLLGCSFTFEGALLGADVPVRNIEEGKNVSMYITNRQCASAGPFSAPLVVTMRPIPEDLVMRAIRITSRYSLAHGAPIHVGDPKTLGIRDLDHPDFGDPVTINRGETPVFWACGVTSSLAVLSARPERCITHAPGHMFITDVLNETLAAM